MTGARDWGRRNPPGSKPPREGLISNPELKLGKPYLISALPTVILFEPQVPVAVLMTAELKPVCLQLSVEVDSAPSRRPAPKLLTE